MSLTHVIHRGSTIYKRTENLHSVGSVSSTTLSWFSESQDRYSYGQFLSTFEILRDINLIDLRNKTTRDRVFATIDGLVVSPDEIYSGGKANKTFQTTIKENYGTCFDGTYISRTGMEEDDDWYGAAEIVLWDPWDPLPKIKRRGGIQHRPEITTLFQIHF